MQRRTVLLIHGDECGWSTVRAGLASLAGAIVVGETADPVEARHIASTTSPDIVITSNQIAGRSVAPLLLNLLRDVCPGSKAIVLANQVIPAEIAAVRGLNVVAYLLWEGLSPEALRGCFAALVDADILMGSRAVADVSVVPRPLSRSLDNVLPAPSFNDRDLLVLRCLAEGLTSKEIAAVEGLSDRSVARTVSKLEAGLDAPNQFVLAHRATLLGLLP